MSIVNEFANGVDIIDILTTIYEVNKENINKRTQFSSLESFIEVTKNLRWMVTTDENGLLGINSKQINADGLIVDSYCLGNSENHPVGWTTGAEFLQECKRVFAEEGITRFGFNYSLEMENNGRAQVLIDSYSEVFVFEGTEDYMGSKLMIFSVE